MTSFEALMKAHHMSRLGRRHYSSVMDFERDLNGNLADLRRSLLDGSYCVGEYRVFEVFEPKKRTIMAVEYKDRVVMHALCDEVLFPFFERRLDSGNVACREGKGTHYGLKKTAEHLRSAYNKAGLDFYILKCDIAKYFYSIRHEVLKNNLYRFIKDRDIRWVCDRIIDSTKGEVGIPIGNLSSQFFAVFYLDGFDRFVREELGVKLYNRYMDDFVLIHHDKEYLLECLGKIKEYLHVNLGLTLNSKTQIFPAKHGVDYLGFHTYIGGSGRIFRKLRHRSKAGVKRKIRAFGNKFKAGRIDKKRIEQSMASWLGHTKFGDCWVLRKKIMRRLNGVLRKG